MERYLYGTQANADRVADDDDDSDIMDHSNSNLESRSFVEQQRQHENETYEEETHSNRIRSKSHDAATVLKDNFFSTELRPGMTRSRTREIEHRISYRNKSLHSIANMQERHIHEKEKLNELNNRLDLLVNRIKMKKLQNDELEKKIKSFKEDMMSATGDNGMKLKKQYTADLDEAKRELNEISQMSSMSKIRASRSMYELDRLREKFDTEIRLQTHAREKIQFLENQRAESLHELSYLKENCQQREKSIEEDADKNEKLRYQLNKLCNRLDCELEQRIDLESRIQTLLEQKKFEEELHKMYNEELNRLFVYEGQYKIMDNHSFYNTELNLIKDRIREDFIKMNEFNCQASRDEYEYMYKKTVEEIEESIRVAEQQRLAQEQEEANQMMLLREEFSRNEEELKNLKLTEFRLNQMYDEVNDKYKESQTLIQSESELRDIEIAELRDKIENLKHDLSSMLGSSKCLDAEVSVYARLLNERFAYSIQTAETSQSTFSYEKYKESIWKDEADARRNQELELQKKQQELEQNQKRLRELELERQRERERIRKQKEEEEERRRLWEIEEEKRRQRELEEQQRRQREIEEQQRRQRELEEQSRRQAELEEQERRRKDLEEQRRRQAELEEQEEKERRRQIEIEEQQRRQRELEEQRRLWEIEQVRIREVEEQQKRQRDLEEKRRIESEQKRLIEEEKQRQRQKEEEHRAKWEVEQKRIKELEAEQKRQFDLEQKKVS